MLIISGFFFKFMKRGKKESLFQIKWNPRILYPHCFSVIQSHSSSKSLAPALSRSIHLTGVTGLHLLCSPKDDYFQLLQYFTVSIHLVECIFIPFIPKGWQFMASCLRLPPRVQSAFQSAAQSAVCEPSYLHQVYPQHSSSKWSYCLNPIDFTGR